MFEQPVRTLSEAQVEEMGLTYYNSDVHRVAFALPQFVRKVSQAVLLKRCKLKGVGKTRLTSKDICSFCLPLMKKPDMCMFIHVYYNPDSAMHYSFNYCHQHLMMYIC